MAVKPFIGSFDSQLMLTCFVIFYFALTLFLSLNQGKLLDAVGKILTPVLVLLLAVLGIAVLVAPQGSIPPVSADYVAHPVVKGLLEGYNTMDTFGALMFGMLIIDVLKSRGIENVKQQTRYLAVASVIAASGLALVYIALFQLGGTAGGIMANPQNGGELVAAYVALLFGPMGSVVLAAIVGLACLTTSVGLTSACADFFHTLWPRFSYKQCAAVIVILCAIVANVGLTQLLVISIPVVFPVITAMGFDPIWFGVVAVIVIEMGMITPPGGPERLRGARGGGRCAADHGVPGRLPFPDRDDRRARYLDPSKFR